MNKDLISSIFSESEINSVMKARRKHIDHPLKRIISPHEHLAKQVSINTNRTFRTAFINNSQWVLGLKSRLLNCTDYSNSSSALGEIRAFGYLCQTGLVVQPLSRSSSPTPEFLIKENNETVHLEVHYKQMDSEEAQGLENFHNKKNLLKENKAFSVYEHVIAPFGKPKQNEITAENAISRIASVKKEEHQLSDTETSILWLDFQDESWNLLNTVERSLPVLTWNGAFYSGEFWYAFMDGKVLLFSVVLHLTSLLSLQLLR